MKRTPRKERKSSDLSKLSKVSFADDVQEYILQETQEVIRPQHPLSVSPDHSSENGGNMQIFVSTPTGKNIALVVKPFFTIGYLKMKIQEKIGLPAHRQRLVLPTGDQLLNLGEGGRNLGDYEIQNESTIQLQLIDPEPVAPVRPPTPVNTPKEYPIRSSLSLGSVESMDSPIHAAQVRPIEHRRGSVLQTLHTRNLYPNKGLEPQGRSSSFGDVSSPVKTSGGTLASRWKESKELAAPPSLFSTTPSSRTVPLTVLSQGDTPRNAPYNGAISFSPSPLMRSLEPGSVVVNSEEQASDDLSDLSAGLSADDIKFVPKDKDGAIVPNTYLNILGNQDDDDLISVLTSATFYTSYSAVSGNNSELCLPDILQDDNSILTPRTTNYSIKHPQPRGHPRHRQSAEGTAATAIQRQWRRRRSNLVNRSSSLVETRPGGEEKDDQTSPHIVSNYHREHLVSKKKTAEEQPTKKLNSQTSNIPSLATTTTQNDGQLNLPPPVPVLPVQNFEEETLYTAVAEARVSADCGSTLNTNERSLFIKQGRCPTCGIQTHRKSGIFKKRSLCPLSNEHVLMGRCLICNPMNIVTHEIATVDALPFNTEGDANNQTVTNKNIDGGRQCSSLSGHTDVQVLGMETKIEDSPKYVPHPPRIPPSVPSFLTFKAEDHPQNRNDSTPSAPLLNDACPGPETRDLQQKRFEEREVHSSSKAGPHGDVERWLLSHLPTLKKDDVKKYCRCLDEDGFDSILMLDVLEEGDLRFMKKAHRRVLTKKMRSRPCVDP